MLQDNQKGFGVIESLLAVIALALVVGIGFYVVNANKDDSKESTPITQSSQPAEAKPAQQKKTEYVEFKDLGFKIKKSDKMTDWSYLDDSQVPQTKYVQSAAHVKAIDACNVGAQYPPAGTPSEKSFAAFSRTDGQYSPNTEGPSSGVLAKQFDTFYISIGYPNGGSPCFNEKGAGYPVDRAPAGAQEALLEALKGAEKL